MAGTLQATALVAVVALGLAACATGDHEDSSAPPTTAAPPTATVTVSVDPSRTTSYADRERARFTYAGADGMVAAGGALWVKTDLGHVVRIDPRTDRVSADVVVDEHTGQSFYCQGIGALAGAVWSCKTRADGIAVVRIDPGTERVSRLVPVGKVFDQLALPTAGGALGVLVDDGSSLSLVDASGEVRTFPLDGRFQQLGGSGDTFVATSVVEDSIVVVDAGTGTVRARLPVTDARMAAVVGDDVWVDSFDGLTHFGDGLTRRTVYPGLVAGPGGDVFSDGDSVWVRASDGTITEIDADSGEPLQRIVPDPPLSGGSLVVAYGSIWSTDSEGGTILRLRRG